MEKKIFRNLFALSAVIVVMTSILTSWVIYRGFLSDMQSEIRQEAGYIAAVNFNGEEYLRDIEKLSQNRITVIDAKGQVVFDNLEDAGNMENHAGRPEVVQALENGHGEIIRNSDTVGMETFYYAVKLENGSILRVANTMSNVYAAVSATVPFMILICAAVLIVTVIIAKHQTKSLVMPINEMNLEDPLSNEVYDEFSPLLRKLAHQNTIIEKTIAELNKERDEFYSITQNMREGLIVLNSEGEILGINRRASEIFGKRQKGHYILLNRSAEFRQVIEEALAGKAAQTILKQEDGRLYSITATPAGDGLETAKGVIVLVLDVTEKEETERYRREFSANVSHELKTPLTSISGYAELIKEGIAKPEDTKMFADKIYTEAKRMITLVEDIMKISRMDEGMPEMPAAKTDLNKICRQVVERLADKAEEMDITLKYSCESDAPVEVNGIPHMIEELVFNLCDNAIKYNKPGGSASVTVSADPVSVKVEDTGIGIAEENQGRIFERFYRVDKSHSKETGGTGLGLSIVKHIVQTHGAEISLKSKEGCGTTIEVNFPVKE